MNYKEEQEFSRWKKMQAKMKRLMKKRWAMPALYLTLAAVLITSFMWVTSDDAVQDLTDDQQDSEFDINGDDLDEAYQDATDEDAVPAATHDEVFELPVSEENNISVVGTFHDYEASQEDQEQALIRYNNYFYQNKGIDFANEDGSTFDVTAAMSGTVVKSEEDALFGQVVHIEHSEDVVSIYQSLDGVTFEVGETVNQGDVIGQAGQNLYNREAGVHAHFEIRKNGVAVNPLEYIEQGLSALPEVSEQDISNETMPEEVPDEGDDLEDEKENDDENNHQDQNQNVAS